MADLQKTNLNTSPYYDDWDETKNFNRVLYRPATAVQARELTQMQTILQNQVAEGSNFIHKECSLIKGTITVLYGANNSQAPSNMRDMLGYVRVDDTFLRLGNTENVSVNGNMEVFHSSNHAVTSALVTWDSESIDAFNTTKLDTGSYLVGATTGIVKKVFYHDNGLEAQYPDTNVLHTLDFSAGFNNGNTTTYADFQKDETLYAFANATSAVAFRTLVKNGSTPANVANDAFAAIKTYYNAANTAQNAVGGSIGVTTTDGIVYGRGHFIRTDKQKIIAQKFDDVAAAVDKRYVGFEIVESIVTPELDSSLYDNATGSTNENAPGAHRLKMEAVLKVFEGTPANTFADVLTISNTGIIEVVSTMPELNEQGLGKKFSDALKDTAGDYVIGAPTLFFKSSNTTHANVQINPAPGGSTLFVNGDKTKQVGPLTVSVRRGTDELEEENVTVSINYGRYLQVKEVAGRFAYDQFTKVYFVNTAIQSITDGSYGTTVASSFAGSIIGNTNLLNLTYNSGTQGDPNALFNLYTDEIKLANNNSMADVAGILICAAGDTDPNNAVGFADLANTTVFGLDNPYLVFDTGRRAIKQYSIAAGTDTAYVSRRRVTNTPITTSGVINFTSTGANYQPNEQGNPLGDALETEYIVVPTSNLQSSNASVTGAVSTGANTIVVSAGTPGDYIEVGDVLEVAYSASYATGQFFRVESVLGTTLTVNSTPTSSNTAANFRRFIPAGVPISLTDSASNVAANSTQVTINTRLGTLGSAVTLTGTLQVDVIFNEKVLEIDTSVSKDINKSRYVKIDTSTNDGGLTGPWNLGLADVHRIRSVYVGSSYDTSVATLGTNMSNKTIKFDLDPGQRDSKYAHGRLKIKIGSNYALSAGDKIIVELDHFTANTTAGGFYNIDSYPISATDPASANSTTILTAEVPIYRSPTTGETFDLRDSVDFRPRVTDTATSATTLAAATENPATSDILDLPGTATASLISTPNKNFVADITTYLGRQDLLTYDGRRYHVTEGVPSNQTKTPLSTKPTNHMTVSSIDVPPYPSLTDTEVITPTIPYTTRNESKFKHKVSVNKRYTMADIGTLANRISKLEYYTSLSILEKSATDLQISDANGLNRFKNGIFADPFNTHVFGDTSGLNGVYKASIDEQAYHLRPTFRQSDVELLFDTTSSTNVSKYASYIGLPLDTTVGANGHVAIKALAQVVNNTIFPISTHSRNLADPVFEHHGQLYLCPEFDTRSENDGDDSFKVNISLDIAAALDPLNDADIFGSWRNNGAQQSSSRASSSRIAGGTRTTTVNTVTQAQARDVYNFSTDVTETTYQLNNLIQDTRINRYVRPQAISWLAIGLLPNARCHFHFDGVLVDEHVRPGRLNGDLYPSIQADPTRIIPSEGLFQDRRDSIVPANDSEIGDAIFADDTGTAYGIFYVPQNTFLQGTRTLTITEFDDLTSSNRMRASSNFLSYGQSYVATDLTLTTVMPNITVMAGTEDQTIVVSRASATSIAWDPPEPSADGDGAACVPIAQTFRIQDADCATPSDPGVFVTELDLFFRTRHPTLGCHISLHETTGGQLVPDFTTSIPYSRVELDPSDVVVTGNESAAVNPTTIKFSNPIYLAKGKIYSFIVGPTAFNDGYSMWHAKIGDINQNPINGGGQVSTRAVGFGTAFYSKNARTWEAIQDEGVTYTMRRAHFDNSGSSTLVVKNAPEEYVNIDTINYANAAFRVTNDDLVINLGNTSARATVDYIREATSNLIMSSSNGGFSANDTIEFRRIHRLVDDSGDPTSNIFLANLAQSNTTVLGNTTLLTVDDIGAHGVVLQVQPMLPSGTTANFNYRGLGNNYAIAANTITMPIDDELEFALLGQGATSRIIASKSNSPANTSATITGSLYSPSPGITPMVDLARRNLLVFTNQISGNKYLESTNDGLAQSRYISKVIELADGQDAEDIEVYLTAYKPPLTGIYVYVKFLSGADPELLEQKAWTELTQVTASSEVSKNSFDIKEYKFGLPTGAPPTDNYSNGTSFSVTTGAYLSDVNPSDTLDDEVITYQDTNGTYYQRYKYYTIKIVMTSTAPEIVPYVKDLRAIALQK